MRESILSNEKRCYVCGSTRNLHRHHIFYGMANRKWSEKYGCWVYLCAPHHNMSKAGVHSDKRLDLRLKAECQAVFEQDHSRVTFISIFGRSWL